MGEMLDKQSGESFVKDAENRAEDAKRKCGRELRTNIMISSSAGLCSDFSVGDG